MTTHRSLNKLEFKAHMSIHNFVDVPETEPEGLTWTRDRFGKKQTLSDGQGGSRLWRRPTALAILWIAFLTAWPGLAQARPNTDIRVESDQHDLFRSVDGGHPSDEKFFFFKDETTATTVGFNDNGDPSWNRNF